MEKVNDLWVEKYRPRTIEEIVMPEDYRNQFTRYFERQEIPNLLLYGPAGGGKTTLARIVTSKSGVVKNINDNVLALNGSAKETRGINFVSDVIEPYLKIPPAGLDKYKFVFIDEADYLTDASFHSLRSIIEKYSAYGRFIFTCNYVSKIPDALQSRLTDYKFKQVSEEFVYDYAESILKKEEIKYDMDNVKYLVSSLYPDIRKIVNKLQRFSVDGDLKIDKNIALSKENLIISSIAQGIEQVKTNKPHGNSINVILNTISGQGIDYREVYTKLFFKKEIPVPFKIIVNKYANSHNNCLVDEAHFMAMVLEGLQTIGAMPR